VLVGALFKPAGDIVEILRIIGAASVIGLSLYMFMQVSQMNAQLAKTQVVIERVEAQLAQPLIVQGGK